MYLNEITYFYKNLESHLFDQANFRKLKLSKYVLFDIFASLIRSSKKGRNELLLTSYTNNNFNDKSYILVSISYM